MYANVKRDIHIGDAGGHASEYLRDCVDRVNRLAKEKNIKMVFLTGDLSNTAKPEEFAEVREIMRGLDPSIPYIPLLGNHDTWHYNDTWEEIHPTGDNIFRNTFADVFSKHSGIISHFTGNDRVWNKEHDIYSYFQNFVVKVEDVYFVSLDWNSRAHAISQLGYKGAMPGAELHNYEGGTYVWLRKTLEDLKNVSKNIVFLQHHPYRTPNLVPTAIFGFKSKDKEHIRDLIESVYPNGQFEQLWGVFCGHFHRWFDGKAFDEPHWENFHQWETMASKVDSSFAIAYVENGRVARIEKHLGTEKNLF